MTKEIKFIDINQHDELWITVDQFSEEVLYEDEKWLSNNERAFIKIFSDGLVDFGLEVQKDPMHNNQKYVWSSNANFINRCFSLLNTPQELAAWHIGAREECSKYRCFFARNILLSKALSCAADNSDKLHYGYIAFEKQNRIRYHGE